LFIVIEPDVGFSSNPIIFNRVVFPLPEGPTIPILLFFKTENDRFFKINNLVSPCTYS